jgi:hypothetical protein
VPDRIALAFEAPIGGQPVSFLSLLCCDAPDFVEVAIPLGSRRPRAIASGEVDGDGHRDLIIGYLDLPRLDVFINQTEHRPQMPMFVEDSLGGWALDLTGIAPLTGAQLALADFDGDGDGDLGYACASGGLVVVTNDLVWSTPRPVIKPLESAYVTDHIDIEIQSVAPTAATHVEVRLWRLELDTASSSDVVIGRKELNQPIQVLVEQQNLIGVPLNESDLQNGGFFCTAQYVIVDGDVVTPSSPVGLFRMVVTNTRNEALLAALSQLPVGTPTVVRQIDGGHQTAVTPIPIPPPPPPGGTTPPEDPDD